MMRIHTSSPEETQQVGRIIGEQARPGDIYLLTGPLGAGKTCLTQGIAWGLGVSEHARSPTFVLMTRYRGRLTLHHLDLYRIGGPAEAWDLGIEEQLLGDGVCVVEWAERAEDIFPEDALWIMMDYAAPPEPGPGQRSKSPQPPFAKGGQAGISGELVEPYHGGAWRTITLGNHSSRYNPLLENLTRALPGAAVCA